MVRCDVVELDWGIKKQQTEIFNKFDYFYRHLVCFASLYEPFKIEKKIYEETTLGLLLDF